MLPDVQLATRMDELDRRLRRAVTDLLTGPPRTDRAQHVRERHAAIADTAHALAAVADADAALEAAAADLAAARTALDALPPAPRRGRTARDHHQHQHDQLTATYHQAQQRHHELTQHRAAAAAAVGVPEHQWATLTSTLPDADTRAAELATAHAADTRAHRTYTDTLALRDRTTASLERGRAEIARRRALTPATRTTENALRAQLYTAATNEPAHTQPAADTTKTVPPTSVTTTPTTSSDRTLGL